MVENLISLKGGWGQWSDYMSGVCSCLGGEDSGRASALQENSATVQVALSICHIWFVLQGGRVEVAELCIVSSKLKTHHEYCSTVAGGLDEHDPTGSDSLLVNIAAQVYCS